MMVQDTTLDKCSQIFVVITDLNTRSKLIKTDRLLVTINVWNVTINHLTQLHCVSIQQLR